MKKLITSLFVLAATLNLAAQTPFETLFEDATLRLDYIFTGDNTHKEIFLADMVKCPVWAGRRSSLGAPLLRGNGQVRVCDRETGEVLYVNSFATLFDEWQATQEATYRPRAYETCLQVPFPKKPVTVQVILTDYHAREVSRIEHIVDPSDILIRQRHPNTCETRLIHGNGNVSEALDLVVLSEGYVEGQQEKFFSDAARIVRDALFETEPYHTCRDKFNIRAVFVPSQDEGPSVPHEGLWTQTVAQSHYDTFYSARYLTTSSMRKVCDAIGTVPYEHIIVLVNTPRYGGGGIYNGVTITSCDDVASAVVFVHEFGHAFAGLADEYAYDEFESMYPADTEPWEPNITTLKDFRSKWADMLPAGTPVPTPRDPLDYKPVRKIWNTFTPAEKQLLNGKLGVYEGAGNTSKGVYRPVQECRMRMNECEYFCPVCQRAIIRTIEFYTK